MSGLARTFAKCYPSYKEHIFDKYDCDIFVHISKDGNSPALDVMSCVKKVVLEKNPVLDEKDYRNYKRKCKKYSVQGLLQQFWKISMCHKLMLDYQKEKGINYDWVIRCRPDLNILGPLPDLSKLDPQYMYIPMHSRYASHYERMFGGADNLYADNFVYDYRDCVPDQIAISSVSLMNIYASRYDELDELVYKRAGELHAEGSLRMHLKYYGIKIKFLRTLFKIER